MPAFEDDEIVPYYETADGETARLYHGDALEVLASLPSQSVHCVITSPPYWGQRDYKAGSQEVGREFILRDYLRRLVAIFREVKRVLRLDGTLFLNLGDKVEDGVVLGVPWRVAFALQEDGWILRPEIIWHKPGGMPSPQKTCCVNAHEYVFLMARNQGYYFDHIAIAEKSAVEPYANRNAGLDESRNDHTRMGKVWGTGLTNKRSVWSIPNNDPTRASSRHYATFPPKLIEPMILAGTSEHGCCAKCGCSYRRVIETEKARRDRPHDYVKRNGESGTGNSCDNSVAGVYVRTVGWKKTCVCDCDEVMPCTVLDPFLGSGTTAVTAISHGRNAVGIELNKDYLRHDAVPRVRKLLLSRPAWRELA